MNTNININGLTEELLSQIVEIILKHKKLEKISIFGSRVNGDFKDTSDIDIAIFGKNWSDSDINIVKHDLDERVKTPLKFDVLNFYKLTKTKLKKNISENGRTIYDSGTD